MRISDWSSDVCSSDLTRWWRTFQHVDHLETHQALGVRCTVLVSIPLPAQVCTVPATIRRILPGPEPATIGEPADVFLLGRVIGRLAVIGRVAFGMQQIDFGADRKSVG